MKGQDLILWFNDLRKEDIPLVGGKCANLGEVSGKLGIPVPNGFAITAYAYKVFLEKTGADRELDSLLSQIDETDMESLQETSKRIRTYLEGLPVPPGIENIIITPLRSGALKIAYALAAMHHGRLNAYVAYGLLTLVVVLVVALTVSG